MNDVSTRGAAPTALADKQPIANSVSLDLSVIVPTFNEFENVYPLIQAIRSSLVGRNFEIIFVDDNSPDGTANRVREIARRDPQIRCVERVGRRGLSSACVEGAFAASAPIVAVIDGDMQHDERLLPCMLETLEIGGFDLVVGTGDRVLRHAAPNVLHGYAGDVALDELGEALAKFGPIAVLKASPTLD